MDEILVNSAGTTYLLNEHPKLFGHSLRFVHINARSVRNKLNILEQTFIGFDKEPDIAVISESWIAKHEIDIYNLPNFNSFHSTRESKRGGGVSIFVRSSILANEVYNVTLDNISFLIIKLSPLNLHVIGIYKPSTSADNIFFECFDRILDKYPMSVILGDLNINYFNQTELDCAQLLDLVCSNGFAILNSNDERYFTRQSNTICTSIDYAITDCLSRRLYYSLHDIYFSDHRMIVLDFQTENHDYKATNKSIQLNLLNHNKLKHFLSINEFTPATFKELIDLLTCAVYNCTYKRTFLLKSSKPWFNLNLKNLMKSRDKFYVLHKQFPVNLYFKCQFVILRNKCAALSKSLKKAFYSNRIIQNNGNAKKDWSLINSLIFNRTTNVTKELSILDSTGKLATDPREVANIFNSFFINVTTMDTPRNIAHRLIKPFQSYLSYAVAEPLKFHIIDDREIDSAINFLKIGSAAGYDQINPKILKTSKQYFVPKLTSLINKCLLGGIFPNELKVARVTPIYKQGDKTVVSNYRPISVVTCFAKIFERTINRQLEIFLNENKIINPNQFGFVKSSNAQVAVANLCNNIYKAIDESVYVSILFIDIQKAFDCINHRTLIAKLEKLNPDEPSINLLRNYLSNRWQYVEINKENVSDRLKIHAGVPQGSVLGPTLFTFYINDIFELNLIGSIQCYADDAAIFYKCNNPRQLLIDMLHDLLLINDWLAANSLSLNLQKTNYIILENKPVPNDLPKYFSFCEVHIKQVSSSTYLGLVIDSKFKWDGHLDKIRKKISPIIFALKKIRHFINDKCAWWIYHAYINSHLSYMNFVWNCTTKDRLQGFYVLQNKSIKCIKHLPRLTPTKLIYSSSILPLHLMYDFEVILFVHKVKLKLIKCNIDIKIGSEIHMYPTRSNQNFYVTNVKKTSATRNVFYYGFISYNDLPVVLKNISNIVTFKRNLKEYVFTKWVNGCMK